MSFESEKALKIRQHRNKKWEILRAIRRLEKQVMILYPVHSGNLIRIRKKMGGYEDIFNRRNKYEQVLNLLLSKRISSEPKVEQRRQLQRWLRDPNPKHPIPLSPKRMKRL